MADRMINIRHPETGENYATRPETFHAEYEPRGFVAGAYEDGAPYEPHGKAGKKSKLDIPQSDGSPS